MKVTESEVKTGKQDGSEVSLTVQTSKQVKSPGKLGSVSVWFTYQKLMASRRCPWESAIRNDIWKTYMKSVLVQALVLLAGCSFDDTLLDDDKTSPISFTPSSSAHWH